MKIGKNKKKVFNIMYVLLGIVVVIFFAKDIFVYTLNEVSSLFYPIQSRIYTVGKRAIQGTESVLNYKDLISDNEKMKKELLVKTLVENKNKVLLEENQRLRELLAMKGTFQYNFKVGKVSFHQTREIYESFAINLGEQDGMKKRMPVLYKNRLIGRIERVEKNYSIVQMITFQDSVVSVKSENQVLGILKGNRSDELTFEPVSTYEADIQTGSRLYTSGISDIYPKDIFVGEVSEIKQKYENHKEYLVKLPFNVSSLDEVVVLTEVGL